jgi:flagellar biosynthetic protein FlhB
MADGGTGEKTEEPTPERLRKLRKEGNVPKSQDINTAVSFLVVFGVLAAVMPFIAQWSIDLLNIAVMAIGKVSGQDNGSLLAYGILMQGLWTMTKCTAPIVAAALVLGLALNIAQVGFMFTVKPLIPNFQKINPVQGFKNIFNKKKLVELLKTILKFIIVAWLSYVALKDAMRDVAMIVRSDLPVGMKVIGAIIWHFCTRIGGAFILIAAADAFYQRYQYMKDNRMSKYDVKQEYKQSEGDPHHKAERRRFHQEILNSAGPAAVKNADVVVRNPDHIAVALKYTKDKGGAPQVLAKGERIWAEKILESARRYGIPVVRNVPLAQALNKVEVGDDIPEELYEAVAEVLNFVYRLVEEQKQKKGG